MVLNLLIFVTSWSAGLALPRSQIAVSMKSAISSPSSQLILGKEIGSGTYGAVYEAQWQQDGTVIDAVAKVARPRTDSDAVLAKQYLDIEAVVYDSLEERRKGRADLDGFCKYVGRTELDGEEWLLWERLPGCGELPRAITLAELNHETGEEAGRETVDEPIWSLSLSSFGLTSRDVLREVLRLTGKLHETGFVHRDIKTANLLLSASEPASTPSIYLIDMGSCAKASTAPRHSLPLLTHSPSSLTLLSHTPLSHSSLPLTSLSHSSFTLLSHTSLSHTPHSHFSLTLLTPIDASLRVRSLPRPESRHADARLHSSR